MAWAESPAMSSAPVLDCANKAGAQSVSTHRTMVFFQIRRLVIGVSISTASVPPQSASNADVRFEARYDSTAGFNAVFISDVATFSSRLWLAVNSDATAAEAPCVNTVAPSTTQRAVNAHSCLAFSKLLTIVSGPYAFIAAIHSSGMVEMTTMANGGAKQHRP